MVDPYTVSGRFEMGNGSCGSGAFLIASASNISQLDSAEVDDISIPVKHFAVRGVLTVKTARTDGEKAAAFWPTI